VTDRRDDWSSFDPLDGFNFFGDPKIFPSIIRMPELLLLLLVGGVGRSWLIPCGFGAPVNNNNE
jgi:hypothetical protein